MGLNHQEIDQLLDLIPKMTCLSSEFYPLEVKKVDFSKMATKK